jgi:elongation factor P--beta-lysine ligase
MNHTTTFLNMRVRINIDNLKNYKVYLKIEEATHQFFKKNHYLRLDLPVLSPALIPESYLEIFEIDFKYFDRKQKLYLIPSPELFMKRLLVEKIGDCYYLGKAFRNGEFPSPLHSPEFSILEFYKVGVDYKYFKKEIQKLLLFIAQSAPKKTKITYGKFIIDLDKKWEEISVAEAFERYAAIKPEELFNYKQFFKRAKAKGYQTENSSYVDLFSQIYTQEIEPNLGVNGIPTIIYNYPKELAALAKLNSDGKTAQRFEFYIAGIELGDCYTELTDWKEQKKRFLEEEKNRRKIDKICHKIDWGFVNSLKKGLPACSGMAIGFDRLAMIFAGVSDIRKLRLINIVL